METKAAVGHPALTLNHIIYGFVCSLTSILFCCSFPKFLDLILQQKYKRKSNGGQTWLDIDVAPVKGFGQIIPL